MHNKVTQVTIAGILHDIGKVLHRWDQADGRAHSISGRDWINKYTDDSVILDCIRYHHHQDLAGAGLESKHPAYAVYLADNIASGLDRREIEGEGAKGFDKKRPQESIYNLLNNADGKAAYRVSAINAKINYPQDLNSYNPASAYNEIIFGLSEGLRGINFQASYVNSLLELGEAYLSYVPSSTYLGEVADISLFDHSKLTAALAACIVLYLSSRGRDDYQRELFRDRHSFYGEKAFCLFSCDISGIQQFIYTISSKGALKGLRSRSFYLELLLEHLVDEILAECGLYRCNLLYAGGGHAYILLPNTDGVRSKAALTVENANRSLLETFDARLFIGHGLQECCGNELMSKTEDPEDYSNIFRSLASQITERKLRRYSAAEIRQLNKNDPDREGRECRVCGASGQLEEREEEVFCRYCAAFADISSMLIKEDTLFLVARDKLQGVSLPLQVTTPNEGENYGSPDYDLVKTWTDNLDNHPEIGPQNRVHQVESINLRFLFLRETAISNIEACNYAAALNILTGVKEFVSADIMGLLKAAQYRKNMDLPRAEKESRLAKYDMFPIKSGDGKELFEYLLLLSLQQQAGQLMDFVRGISPALSKLFEFFYRENVQDTSKGTTVMRKGAARDSGG